MSVLTRNPEIDQTAKVSNRVRNLLSRAEDWCREERGRQTKLADALGVKRQAVSIWFSEYRKDRPKNSPTAEQALGLAAFLKQQARKERKPKAD
jgi:cobalamin biosynthesis protein CbiG